MMDLSDLLSELLEIDINYNDVSGDYIYLVDDDLNYNFIMWLDAEEELDAIEYNSDTTIVNFNNKRLRNS
tara:strand:- start:77 stop:286 length:210 start_codon:yes stop_codon:yes gene_type:complete